MEKARWRRVDRDGFAMATTLLVILVVSVVAVGAAWLAATEKRTSFAESVHVSAVFSADAGGEGAINFLRLSDSPPQIIDFSDQTVWNQGTTTIHADQTYEYECRFLTKRLKPGWGIEYLDFDYNVVSSGTASRNGLSAVELIASRLFKEGY